MNAPRTGHNRPFPQGSPVLLAFDLDGTLIPELGDHVPDDTVNALARLRAMGAKIAIITGRDTVPRAVLDAVQPDATGTNNGGRVELGGTLHTEARFTDADLEAILAHELNDARVALFTRDGLFVDLPSGATPEPWMVARGYRPLTEAARAEVLKVGFYHPLVAQHADRLGATHPHLVLTGAQEPYTEFLTVTPAGAHKGAALGVVAQALGIALERTVAFGDSDNDVAMLEVAGFAVQVGSLSLLAPHADEQITGPEALGAYLTDLAGRLALGTG